MAGKKGDNIKYGEDRLKSQEDKEIEEILILDSDDEDDSSQGLNSTLDVENKF